jgi:hypothetical protein
VAKQAGAVNYGSRAQHHDQELKKGGHPFIRLVSIHRKVERGSEKAD